MVDNLGSDQTKWFSRNCLTFKEFLSGIRDVGVIMVNFEVTVAI